MMKFFYLFSCFMLLFLLSTCLNAQTLERKGSLGVMIANTDAGDAVFVRETIPGGTAQLAGFLTEDIILAIDGIPVKTTSEIIAITSKWRAGNSFSAVVERAGERLQLAGKIVGKPLETSAYGMVKYGAVPYDGGMLRSILITPKGVENPPVIFFLQGFSCASIDYYYNKNSVIKQLVENWVKAGIAVYRVEKPGMGDCQGLPDCESIGYDYEVEAFRTALEHLKSKEGFDAERVFLFGHSLGGVTAPAIAAQSPVKGIANFGSVHKSWYDYLLTVLWEQEVIFGTDYLEIEKQARQRSRLLYEYLVEKKSPGELEKNPLYNEIMPTGLPMRDGDKMIGRHYTFMQEINDVRLNEAYQKANCYVLALHGEFDIHAVNHEWAEYTSNLVNSYYPGKGNWKIISGTEHAFAKVPDMETYVKLRNEGTFTGSYMDQHFNPEVAKIVADWVKGLTDAKTESP